MRAAASARRICRRVSACEEWRRNNKEVNFESEDEKPEASDDIPQNFQSRRPVGVRFNSTSAEADKKNRQLNRKAAVTWNLLVHRSRLVESRSCRIREMLKASTKFFTVFLRAIR